MTVGRPRKAPEKGRRQNYTFRMSDQARDSVIESASRGGRSVSEELERIVEAHFAASDTRQIIREEIRAALDIKDARAIGMSLSVSGGAVPTVAGFDRACAILATRADTLPLNSHCHVTTTIAPEDAAYVSNVDVRKALAHAVGQMTHVEPEPIHHPV